MSVTNIIRYSPELIQKLDQEEKDYPIDPMVLAILNGIKKTKVEMGPGRSGGSQHGGARGPRTYYGGHSSGHGGGRGGPGRGPGRHRGGPRYENPDGNGFQRVRGNSRPTSKPIGPRKKLYEEPSAFTDDRLISDIRTVLGKLSSENSGTITSQLLKLKLDKEDCIPLVAEVLHESAINGIFIVDYFVGIFLNIGKAYPKVIPELNRRILRQISQPNMFEESEDTLTETCKQKSDRWQISNALLMAELYKRGVYSDDLLVKVCRLYIDRISSETPEKQFPLKIIVEFFPPILEKVVQRMTAKDKPLQIQDVFAKLEAISQDKSYPGPVRFPVMTLIKDWKNRLC